jgi:hypothetical protein
LWFKSIFLLGGLLLSSPAEAGCEQPYMGSDIVADLGTLTVSLRDLDQEAYNVAAVRMEAGLGCIRETLPPLVFSSAYRYIGTRYYFEGDLPNANRWLRSALEIDPNFAWDINEIDEDHPLRGVMAKARAEAQTSPVTIEGMELNIPSGSRLLMDGRNLTRPEATADRPHLLQVVAESDDSVRQVLLIEGYAIPERFLVAAGSTEPVSDGGTQALTLEEDLFRVSTIERVRPKAKTPLMVAGGATGLAASGLYILSNRYRTDFEAAGTTEALEKSARMTNTMVLLTGITLAAGLGVEFAGVRMGVSGAGISIGRSL